MSWVRPKKVSMEGNTSDAFVLLVSLDFKLFNKHKRNTGNASDLNAP